MEKLIQELPYKEKDKMKVFCISSKEVRIWYGRKVPESNQKSPRNIGVQGEAWIPQRDLREGCPSSLALCDIYHQVSMRVATKERKKKAEELDLDVGLSFKWVPGSSVHGINGWEKPNSEAKRLKLDKALFADDTTKIGNKNELDIGVRVTKEVMARLEERNNEDMEEVLEFGEEAGNIQGYHTEVRAGYRMRPLH